MTRMVSADWMVDRRWAMSTLVRPVIMRARAWRTRCSVSVSTELVASSRMRRPGEGADEVADVDLVGGLLHGFVGNPVRPEADVVRDGAGEEEGILQDDAEALAQGLAVLLAGGA